MNQVSKRSWRMAKTGCQSQGMQLDNYNATNIDFYDLTAIVKKKWIITFCEMIEQRGMKFTWQLPSGTRSEAIDAGTPAFASNPPSRVSCVKHARRLRREVCSGMRDS